MLGWLVGSGDLVGEANSRKQSSSICPEGLVSRVIIGSYKLDQYVQEQCNEEVVERKDLSTY